MHELCAGNLRAMPGGRLGHVQSPLASIRSAATLPASPEDCQEFVMNRRRL